jgi:RNA polymerase sigma factor (TIGR02999 family)
LQGLYAFICIVKSIDQAFSIATPAITRNTPVMLRGGGESFADQAGGLGPIPEDVLVKCYGDMRRMARRILRGNVLGRALQPTELANEAVIRLIRTNLANAQDEGHLLAIAARTMRQILVDEARKSVSAKRQSPVLMTTWPGGDALVDMADLDGALAALAEISPIRAEIVELRFMLGMTVEETAAATGIPERSVKRHWQAARAWLLGWLNEQSA